MAARAMKSFLFAVVLGLQVGSTWPQSIQTTEDLVNLLRYHGYTAGYGERAQPTSKEIQEGLERFQEFYGIPVTGVLDETTREEMEQEKCDVPDLRTPRYSLAERKWVRNLTWRLNTVHQSISRSDARRVITAALQEWTSQVGLIITESSTSRADIVIDFASSDVDGNHGDNTPFKTKTLAHAFYPGGSALAGDVHVNMKFSFSTSDPPPSSRHSLLAVLVHELGHSLGLRHSSVKNSIMFPTIGRGTPYGRLQADDIYGIRALYGSLQLKQKSMNMRPFYFLLLVSLFLVLMMLINVEHPKLYNLQNLFIQTFKSPPHVNIFLQKFKPLQYGGFSSRHIKNIFVKKDNVIHLHDLCIEPGSDGVRLVSYNSDKNRTENLKVQAGPHYKGGAAKWTVHLSTLPLPWTPNYTYTQSAFFVSTTCEGNFHHFWFDCVNGLFGAMKATHMLGSPNPSQLYYADDVWNLDTLTGCHIASRFQDILYALPVKKEHIYYKDAKPRSCFANAVFGYYSKGYSLHEKREHFKHAFNIECQPSKKTRVTIINRNYRKILNAKELKKAAQDAGYLTSVVFLSDLSIKEQFNVIMCTDILVGVQGAGLRWIDFLPPKKSALLELTWRHWGSFYARQARSQGKKAVDLSAVKVTLNLPLYFKIVRIPHPNITEKLLKEYYKKGPENEFKNHWKFGDGVFDVTKFVQRLRFLKGV